MLPPLTIIPAGAGSGKTHTIQEQLGQWVTDGLVSPSRIVAVTYTEVAAAELRERIGGRLLELGRLEEALQLDQAYISTIHGFGLRLLKEFAFDAGLSPELRLLSEDEQETLLRLALARTDKATVITDNLSYFGYQYNVPKQISAEDAFRNDLLRMLVLLRSTETSADESVQAELASEYISRHYGMTFDARAATDRLKNAVVDILDAFPENLANEFGNSDKAQKELDRDFKNLKAAVTGDVLTRDWKLWQQLRNMRISNRRCKLPESYDQLAQAVIDAADALPGHPGPLEHALRHVQTLIAAANDVLSLYTEAKHESGLVDYADMIVLGVSLLREHEAVRKALVERIDCLVVDEFQDTNPQQFALLWQLKEAGVPTVIVGDMKQAIMGFQGADPRLFSVMIEQNLHIARPLTRNWRSQPALMDFINAVGPTLFQGDYVPLRPERSDSDLQALEIIEFTKRVKPGTELSANNPAQAVGLRVKALLEDPTQVITDRKSKTRRRLRGGDIAILCPFNKTASQYASVLRQLGLSVKLQEPGWHASRVVELACQALTFVANPSDRHSALYLAVTELGGLDLESAMKQLIEDGGIDDPVLDRLKDVANSDTDQTLYTVVAEVISVLDLFDVASRWPDADQARANLIRLQAEAGEFMNSNREALACGGYHGTGIQSFLSWLNQKMQQKNGNNQPDPRVLDEDAIELVTWHSSKGREWPVVFVCGMDTKRAPRLPDMALGYQSFDDLTNLIQQAMIEYSPQFAAPESNERFLTELRPSALLETRRLIYVAMTRAREKLVLEWPSCLEGKAGPTFWSTLAPDIHVSQEKSQVTVGESSFPCLVIQGNADRKVETPHVHDDGEKTLASTGRRAISRDLQHVEKTTLLPDSVTPSGLVVDARAAPDRAHTLETLHYHDGGIDAAGGLSGSELGTLLHRCFEVLGANPGLAADLPGITGVALEEPETQAIAVGVARFEKWMAEHFKPDAVYRELPLLGMNDNASIMSGTADLVLELAEGAWVIDHKSDHVEDPELAFAAYRPQLECYRRLLEDAGHTVLGVGINWIRRGEVVLARLPD